MILSFDTSVFSNILNRLKQYCGLVLLIMVIVIEDIYIKSMSIPHNQDLMDCISLELQRLDLSVEMDIL